MIQCILSHKLSYIANCTLAYAVKKKTVGFFLVAVFSWLPCFDLLANLPEDSEHNNDVISLKCHGYRKL